MSGQSLYEAAKEGVSIASVYINIAYTKVKDATGLFVKKADEVGAKAEEPEKKVSLESQASELAQSGTIDPTGKEDLNLINRCATLLDEDDAKVWDDTYIRPDIVNHDKARVYIKCVLVENED